MEDIDKLIQHLTKHKRNLSCSGKERINILKMLSKIGFEVDKDSPDGHKVFKHKGLTSYKDCEFRSLNLTCGHGSEKTVKMPYILDIIKCLKKYKAELKELNKGK